MSETPPRPSAVGATHPGSVKSSAIRPALSGETAARGPVLPPHPQAPRLPVLRVQQRTRGTPLRCLWRRPPSRTAAPLLSAPCSVDWRPVRWGRTSLPHRLEKWHTQCCSLLLLQIQWLQSSLVRSYPHLTGTVTRYCGPTATPLALRTTSRARC